MRGWQRVVKFLWPGAAARVEDDLKACRACSYGKGDGMCQTHTFQFRKLSKQLLDAQAKVNERRWEQ